MTLPNVVIRNDPATGRRIPAIVHLGYQYNDVQIFFKDGKEVSVKSRLNLLGLASVPSDYDIVKLDYNEEWLVFEFYKQYGEGMRTGVEQAISSFSVPSRSIDRIEWHGQGLGNDYTL